MRFFVTVRDGLDSGWFVDGLVVIVDCLSVHCFGFEYRSWCEIEMELIPFCLFLLYRVGSIVFFFTKRVPLCVGLVWMDG